MRCYVSFPDEAIFSGVTLPEEPSTTQLKEASPKSAQSTWTSSPVEVAAMKIIEEEPSKKEQPPIISQAGRRCYTPPGQSLLLDRFLLSLRAPSGGLVVGALVRGLLHASGQRISQRLKTPSQRPCHQQGCWMLPNE